MNGGYTARRSRAASPRCGRCWHLKNWRILARYHGRREHFDTTIRAIASLLSDHQHTDRTEITTGPLKALPTTPHHR